MLDWSVSRGLGLSKVIGLGGRADLSETDLFEALVEDPHRVVGQEDPHLGLELQVRNEIPGHDRQHHGQAGEDHRPAPVFSDRLNHKVQGACSTLGQVARS